MALIDVDAYRAGLRCRREFLARLTGGGAALVGGAGGPKNADRGAGAGGTGARRERATGAVSAADGVLRAYATQFCRNALQPRGPGAEPGAEPAVKPGAEPGTKPAAEPAAREPSPVHDRAPLRLETGDLCAEAFYARQIGHSGDSFEVVVYRGGTRVRESDLLELGFLLHVAAERGLELPRIWLLLLDGEYRRRGALQTDRLFQLHDATAAAKRYAVRARQAVPELIAAMQAGDAELPARCARVGYCPVCDGPREELALDDLRTLGGKRSTVRAWYNAGYRRITELPEDAGLDRVQEVQRRAISSGEPYLEPDELRSFLASITFPVAFLDFEAVNSPLPLYEDCAPFEHVPFLVSVHRLEHEQAPARHLDFVMQPGCDQREELLRRVIGAVEGAGAVVVYDAAFERRVLARFAQRFPQHAHALQQVGERIRDLFVPFRSLRYYHPEQRGRYSMKTILPLLCGADWSDLAVQDGRRAGELYLRLCLDAQAGASEAPETALARLKQYCRRDTAAMIRIYRALVSAVSGG